MSWHDNDGIATARSGRWLVLSLVIPRGKHLIHGRALQKHSITLNKSR